MTDSLVTIIDDDEPLRAGLDPTHRPLTHRRALGPVARTIALRAVTRR